MKRALVFTLSAVLAAPAAALTPEELFQKLSPSVYVVHTWDQQGKRLALGSAVVIGRERVVTNCHVLRQASAIAISRGNVSYGAELEYPDAERDLCQLSVKELAAPAVALGELAGVKIGQRVYAIGAPQGLELTLTEGLVSSLRGGDDKLIQTSAPISSGSSGGGLFDVNGQLIGITTLRHRESEQLNIAVPVDWVREVESRGKEALARRKQQEEARAAAAKAGANPTAVAALAPFDPSLPKEMPQPGDTWTYVALDVLYKPGDRSRKFVHTVRSSAKGAIVEVVTREGAQTSQEAFSPDLSAVYRSGAEVLEVAPFITAFRTPQPGERWGGIRIRGMESIPMAAATGEVPYHFESGQVVGTEKITVPAGTFDAIRVELNGRVSNILTGGSAVIRGYTSFRQTVWYAPQVKRVIKSLARGPNSTVAYELESYSLR